MDQVEAGLPAYQAWVVGRMNGGSLDHAVFGLCEEAGEVAGKMKRRERGDYEVRSSEPGEFQKVVIEELGDTLFYLSYIAHRMGVTIEEVARRNIEKIEDRKRRGKILGVGDSR